MDRRQRKTRAAIMGAFIKLLAEKDYARITVQEVLDSADVGRTTFYAHFETKDALLEELCAEVFGHVFDVQLKDELTHDFSNDNSVAAHVTHVLYHLNENMGMLRGLVAEGDSSAFSRVFKGYVLKLFEDVIDESSGDVPRDYLLNHITCDFTEAVRWWARNPAYLPEEVSHYFMATSMPTV